MNVWGQEPCPCTWDCNTLSYTIILVNVFLSAPLWLMPMYVRDIEIDGASHWITIECDMPFAIE